MPDPLLPFPQQVGRFADRSRRGSPSDQDGVRILGSVGEWSGHHALQRGELLQPLRDHRWPDFGKILRDMAVLRVFIAVGTNQMPALPGAQAGRNSILLDPVALISALIERSGVRQRWPGLRRCVEQGQREAGIRQVLIGEDDDRNLEPLGKIERANRFVVHVLRIRRRQYRLRELSVPGVNRKQEVFLCRSCREAGCRTRTLRDHDDHRCFYHSGETDGFGHQREAAAGGGRDCARAGEACADRHVDRGDLIFGLLDQHAKALISGERRNDPRGGRHRIGGHEPAAGCGCGKRDGIVSAQEQEPLISWRERRRTRFTRYGIDPCAGCGNVGRDDIVTLLAEPLREESFERSNGDADQ